MAVFAAEMGVSAGSGVLAARFNDDTAQWGFGVMAAVWFVIAAVSWWRGRHSGQMTDQQPPTYSAVSHNQQGGVTAGQYINQAPEPSVTYERLTTDERRGDLFASRYRFAITSGATSPRLIVVASGDSVVDADHRVSPYSAAGGVSAFNLGGVTVQPGDGGIVVTWNTPGSLVDLNVLTSRPGSPIDIQARCD